MILTERKILGPEGASYPDYFRDYFEAMRVFNGQVLAPLLLEMDTKDGRPIFSLAYEWRLWQFPFRYIFNEPHLFFYEKPKRISTLEAAHFETHLMEINTSGQTKGVLFQPSRLRESQTWGLRGLLISPDLPKGTYFVEVKLNQSDQPSLSLPVLINGYPSLGRRSKTVVDSFRKILLEPDHLTVGPFTFRVFSGQSGQAGDRRDVIIKQVGGFSLNEELDEASRLYPTESRGREAREKDVAGAARLIRSYCTPKVVRECRDYLLPLCEITTQVINQSLH